MANGISGSDIRRGLSSFLTGTPRSELERRDMERDRARVSDLGNNQETALNSMVQSATQLKQIQDPQQKLAFLQRNKQQLSDAGIDTGYITQAEALIGSGLPDDLIKLEKITDHTIQVGQQLRSGQSGIKSSAPIEITNPETGERVRGIESFNPNTGSTSFTPVELPEGFELSRETAKAKRDAEVEATIDQEKGKLIAKQRQTISTEINKGARASRRQLPRINKLLEGLELVETGALANAKLLLGPFIPGVDPTNEQATQAQMNSLVLDIIGRFPGSVSDAETAFAKQTTANLGFTPEANKLILNHAKQAMNDLIDEESQFKEFKEGGGTAEDFEFKAVRAPQPLFSQTLGREITEQDIDDTAKARGITRDQVIEKLGVR